jgi:Bacterial cell division membrane protein
MIEAKGKLAANEILLLTSLFCIFLMGLVMIFDTSSAEVLDLHLQKHTYTALVKQIAYGCVGFLLGVFLYKKGPKKILDNSTTLIAIFTFLLILPFVPIIGKTVNGSHRWITIGVFSFQPSEFVKYISLAFLIQQMAGIEPTFKKYLKCLGLLFIPLFLILIEPNNGTVFVIVITLVVASFLAKVPFKYWGIPLLIAVMIGAASVAALPYAQARVKNWLHPEMDLRGKGHQPYQAKIATGTGGLLGKGPGKSLQKLSYLPEAQNDFIAAIFAEEYGFLGVVTLILLYATFILTGYLIILTKKEEKVKMLSSGIVFLVGFQAFLNLSVVTGLLPSTGLNLPFFSQGGSSLIANAAFVGLLLRKDE